jgi:hypothetical protein
MSDRNGDGLPWKAAGSNREGWRCVERTEQPWLSRLHGAEEPPQSCDYPYCSLATVRSRSPASSWVCLTRN